jgi:hypothetical protein
MPIPSSAAQEKASMAEGLLPPEEGEFDDLDVDELEDVCGGLGAPLDETNSHCTINGNCGCQA